MPTALRFGDFEVDLTSGLIRRHGIRVSLREQSFQVLAALIERPGEVVTRESLRVRLWPEDVFVDFDNNLNAAMARLREALGDSAEQSRFIETLPKRGYRFIVPVAESVPAPDRPRPSRARLVVLPFVNLTGNPGQEDFSDAMTEEIITELGGLSPERLRVIARTTAMHYKGTQKDAARIARELNVDYLVEGGVRIEHEHVAITVQLIRASDQTHLFARRYDAILKDVFEMRRPIAEAIASRLGVPADANEMQERLPGAGARRKPTESLAAYNDYIQGRYLLERGTPEALAGARRHLEAAIASDPEFALAFAAMAEVYSTLGYFGFVRPKDAYSAGMPFARRAVEIDDTLAEAHAVLAEYHKQLDYDWPAAEREMARALELDPASPLVRTRNAVSVLMPHGRVEEAIAELRGAIETSPLDRFTRAWLACMLLIGGEEELAIDEARRLLEIEPTSCWAYFFMGCGYSQLCAESASGLRRAPASESELDFAEEAIRAHRKAIELSPGSTFFLGWLGMAFGMCGRQDDARSVLAELRQMDGYTLPSAFAHTYLGLGDLDATFEWFDRAVDERDQMMMPILSYRRFEALGADPRFAALVRRMKLG